MDEDGVGEAQEAVLHAKAELSGRYFRLLDQLDELPNDETKLLDCYRDINQLIVYAEKLRLALRGLSQPVEA